MSQDNKYSNVSSEYVTKEYKMIFDFNDLKINNAINSTKESTLKNHNTTTTNDVSTTDSSFNFKSQRVDCELEQICYLCYIKNPYFTTKSINVNNICDFCLFYK